MLYHITTSDLTTHSLELPIKDTATWEEFVSLAAVEALGHDVIDITPDGMPDRWNDGEALLMQLGHMGLKKTQTLEGTIHYEDIDDSLSDSD
jgi:hypothetical protein